MKVAKKKIIVLFSVFCLLLANFSVVTAYASQHMLQGCTLRVICGTDGVGVEVYTRFTTTADEIGVKDVVLQEKTWYGWKDIKINDSSRKNSDVFSGSTTYTGAEKGKTYRAKCTHYAVYGGKTQTLTSQTAEMVYN